MSQSLSHGTWHCVTWSLGRPAGVDGDVVGPGVPRLGLEALGLHVLAPWEKTEEQEARPRAAQTQPVRAVATRILPFPAPQETPASIQMLFAKMT